MVFIFGSETHTAKIPSGWGSHAIPATEVGSIGHVATSFTAFVCKTSTMSSEHQEIARHLPDICHLSCGGKGTALCGGSFILVLTPPRTGHIHPFGSVSNPLPPSAGWSLFIWTDIYFSAIDTPGMIQGCLALPVAPETQPNQTTAS